MDDLNQTFELLNSGRIDATLNAEVTFYDYTKEHPDANVKIAVLTQDANEVAIPLRKGDETATLDFAAARAIIAAAVFIRAAVIENAFWKVESIEGINAL